MQVGGTQGAGRVSRKGCTEGDGGCVLIGEKGNAWDGGQTAPLQALIICNTISAAPRLCSRDCWYRSLCFSISFSWGVGGAGVSGQQPSRGP